jgi:hypothetical protein
VVLAEAGKTPCTSSIRCMTRSRRRNERHEPYTPLPAICSTAGFRSSEEWAPQCRCAQHSRVFSVSSSTRRCTRLASSVTWCTSVV